MFYVGVGQTILHPCGPKTTMQLPTPNPHKPPALWRRLLDVRAPCVPVGLKGAGPGGRVPVRRGSHAGNNQRVLHGCKVSVGLGELEDCHYMDVDWSALLADCLLHNTSSSLLQRPAIHECSV